MPTLQQLRYLTALADHLHFRRAAEACHVTQPTLSAQIKELEGRLGVTLVERTRGNVLLTPLGHQIAERGRRIQREVQEIRAMARTSQAMLSSVIRVGVVQSVCSYFLPLVIPDLHESYPKLGLYVREGLPEVLLDGLQDGALDLLFFPMPVARSELTALPLFREPIHVVAPRDHALAGQEAVDPANLRDERILSLEAGHRLDDLVRQICADFGAVLSEDYAGTSLDTLRQMVATGMGVSLMPALYVRSEVTREEMVVARPFAGAPPSRVIGMVWRQGTAQEDEFRLLARIICAALQDRAPEVTVLA